MSPSMLVDYHYKLGMGLVRFGQEGRGRTALAEALTLAESHQLNAWYFKVEQAIAAVAQNQSDQPRTETSNLSAAPAVREMELGLREYALAAAV
jgi:hypothetical protein